MSTRVKWDTIFTATLVICALITTGLVGYRQLFGQSAGSASRSSLRGVFIPNWRSELAAGVPLGPSNAPVQLVEFSDFECPYCASLHANLKSVLERFPADVAITYVHFPLSMHRFAVPAARVAECAGNQGRFAAMHDLLFEEQNEFGLKPWNEFATDAKVPDLAAFEACIQNKEPVRRVIEGLN